MTRTVRRPGARSPGIDDVTRREFLIGGAALLLYPVGCGGDEDSGDGVSGETRKVKHVFGETEVPQSPRRIVVLDYEVLENAIAVGVEPVGTPDPGWVGLPDFLQERVEDFPSIGNIGSPNFERVAEQEPDLIVVGIAIDNFTEASYETLSEIAPTVAVARAAGSQAEWQRTFEKTAELFGRRKVAREALREYARRTEGLRRRLEDRGEAEVSVVRFYAGGRAEFRTGGSFPVSVLRDVGLDIPEAQTVPEEDDEGFVVVSEERIGLLEGDVIFVAPDPGLEGAQESYRGRPLWDRLRAVREGQVYEVDGSYWIFGSILSANVVLDDLEKYLV